MHLLYALGWAGFGLGHSLLAREWVKNRLEPLFGASYRLAYNLFAALQLGAILWLGEVLLAGGAVYDWPLWLDLVRFAGLVLGVAVLVVALRDYDMGRFSGISQVRAALAGRSQPDPEPLHVAGLHRYVRHPLYLGTMLVIWGRVTDEASLALALWASVYFLIGARFEERALLRLYGRAYAGYRHRVPAFLPWRGRVAID